MNVVCPSCGGAFECGVHAGNSCFCFQETPVPLMQGVHACFCRNCLKEKALLSESPSERTYRFWVAYNGASFSGFQFQPQRRTVELILQEALLPIAKKKVSLQVAGRTDAGVHASGQAISATFRTRLSTKELTLALAHRLPADVSIWRIDQMPSDFDARFMSIGKRYVYRIYQGLVVDPFWRSRVWHIRKQLNVQNMQKAAQAFVGEKDYESFRSKSCLSVHARRYLWQVEVSLLGHMIEIDVRGNAFCLNMVRVIVGTLVEVGLGKRKPEDMAVLFEAKDRRLSGKTAPPYGLSLEKVYYPDELEGANIPHQAQFPRFPITKNSWPYAESDIRIGPLQLFEA